MSCCGGSNFPGFNMPSMANNPFSALNNPFSLLNMAGSGSMGMDHMMMLLPLLFGGGMGGMGGMMGQHCSCGGAASRGGDAMPSDSGGGHSTGGGETTIPLDIPGFSGAEVVVGEGGISISYNGEDMSIMEFLELLMREAGNGEQGGGAETDGGGGTETSGGDLPVGLFDGAKLKTDGKGGATLDLADGSTAAITTEGGASELLENGGNPDAVGSEGSVLTVEYFDSEGNSTGTMTYEGAAANEMAAAISPKGDSGSSVKNAEVGAAADDFEQSSEAEEGGTAEPGSDSSHTVIEADGTSSTVTGAGADEATTASLAGLSGQSIEGTSGGQGDQGTQGGQGGQGAQGAQGDQGGQGTRGSDADTTADGVSETGSGEPDPDAAQAGHSDNRHGDAVGQATIRREDNGTYTVAVDQQFDTHEEARNHAFEVNEKPGATATVDEVVLPNGQKVWAVTETHKGLSYEEAQAVATNRSNELKPGGAQFDPIYSDGAKPLTSADIGSTPTADDSEWYRPNPGSEEMTGTDFKRGEGRIERSAVYDNGPGGTYVTTTVSSYATQGEAAHRLQQSGDPNAKMRFNEGTQRWEVIETKNFGSEAGARAHANTVATYVNDGPPAPPPPEDDVGWLQGTQDVNEQTGVVHFYDSDNKWLGSRPESEMNDLVTRADRGDQAAIETLESLGVEGREGQGKYSDYVWMSRGDGNDGAFDTSGDATAFVRVHKDNQDELEAGGWRVVDDGFYPTDPENGYETTELRFNDEESGQWLTGTIYLDKEGRKKGWDDFFAHNAVTHLVKSPD